MSELFHRIIKRKDKPALVCIPGLLGGPEDFNGILESIEDQFTLIFIDPNQGRKEKGGLSQLGLEETVSVSYDSSSEQIDTLMKENEISEAYFMGLSIGGKVLYNFAIRYPEKFLGGVVSDVAPTSCIDSDLYRTVDHVVTKTDLTLPWTELKERLKSAIPDRSLRSLVQSQITYPGGNPPGIWKTGMRGLRTLLMRNSIDDQSEAFSKMNNQLLKERRLITILHSSHMSGITGNGLNRVKDEWSSLKIVEIKNAAHFLHVTHKTELRAALMDVVKRRNDDLDE